MDRYRVNRRWLKNKAGRNYLRYMVVDYRTGQEMLTKPVTRPTAHARAHELNERETK